MEVKRIVTTVLAFCLLLSTAFAEGQNGNVLDDIGGWFSQAWQDSSEWVSQA